MHEAIKMVEKYEHQGWPSLARPDLHPPAGWSHALVTAVNRVRHHALSPNGDRIAFIWDRDARSDLFVMPAAGGWPQRLTVERAPSVYWADEQPRWSPDGQWLAVTLHGHVQVVRAAGGLPRNVSQACSGASEAAWLPDSRRLVLAVEQNDSTQLVLTDRLGAMPRSLTQAAGDHTNPQAAPDGSKLVCVYAPRADLNCLALELIDLQSGAAHLITNAPHQKDSQPRWSPDGRRIAFLSQRAGYTEIWSIAADGSGLQQLTHAGADFAEFAWSADGRQLAATLNRNGALDLVLVDAGSGTIKDLRAGRGVHWRPAWAPAGTFITVEYETHLLPPDLYRIDAQSGASTQLTFSNPAALAALQLREPEQLSYRSRDGLEIPALLFRPAQPNGAAILYPHGGPNSQYICDWDIIAQYFVAKGYAWLAPNFRGSSGYGAQFEHANYNDWGNGDMQDCLAGVRLLGALPAVDAQRIGISGGSYGGYMTACCLSRDPDYLLACGVSRYGDANLYSSWAQCNRDVRLYTEMMVGHPARSRAMYATASPIKEVGQVRKPVLVLHGLDDTVVPPESSEEWVDALRRAGKTFEYKTYAGEPHGFLKRETQMDALARMERFFDWYLVP